MGYTILLKEFYGWVIHNQNPINTLKEAKLVRSKLKETYSHDEIKLLKQIE